MVVIGGITTKNPNPLIATGPSGISCQKDAGLKQMCNTHMSHLLFDFSNPKRISND